MGLNVTVLNWELCSFGVSNLVISILTGMKPAVSLLEHMYHELQIDVCMRAVPLLLEGKMRITREHLPTCL